MDILTSVGCAGNGGGAMKNFQRLVRGIWAPGSNEFLQPSLWVTACVCVGLFFFVHARECACVCERDSMYEYWERELACVCLCACPHLCGQSVQVRFLVHILSLTWVPWWMVLITMYTFALHLNIYNIYYTLICVYQILYQFPKPTLSVTQACKYTGWVWGVFMHIHM